MRFALPLLLTLLTPSLAFAYGESQNGFPNWQERVIHEWMNRARCDPQVEMASCGGNCPEAACYKPIAPLSWSEKLNHAARFHSDEMAKQGYFSHNSKCTLVPNIDALYPGTCDGSASCACVGGTMTCNPTCTAWNQRVQLFGTGTTGEIIASPSDPNQAFYLWLFESYDKTTCAYDQGPPTNGHRWNILKSNGCVGAGLNLGPAVGDFNGCNETHKVPSAAHYPRQAASVEAWANWYDMAGPMSALINVDGTCMPLTLKRGTPDNGAYMATLSGFGSGCHRYYFSFTDSNGVEVTYPDTGSLGLGPAASCADWDMTRPPAGAGCACAPSCNGKQCGDDGCGGVCGMCAPDAVCVAGQCMTSGSSSSSGGASSSSGGASSSSSGGTGGASSSGNGGNGGNGGSVGEGGSAGAGGGGSTDEAGSCSCRVGEPRNGSLAALLLLLAPLGLRRRRRA